MFDKGAFSHIEIQKFTVVVISLTEVSHGYLTVGW